MKLLPKLFRKEPEPEGVIKNITSLADELQVKLHTCRERIAKRNQFYATLPLGREGERKLPKNQWVYFLRGSVGIKYVGENLTSSVTYIRTHEEIKLPNLTDSERSHKLRVINGYIIDRRTNRKYSAGESIDFQRGEPMHLTINGYVWMTWTPPLPGSTLPFYHSNHASNS